MKEQRYRERPIASSPTTPIKNKSVMEHATPLPHQRYISSTNNTTEPLRSETIEEHTENNLEDKKTSSKNRKKQTNWSHPHYDPDSDKYKDSAQCSVRILDADEQKILQTLDIKHSTLLTIIKNHLVSLKFILSLPSPLVKYKPEILKPDMDILILARFDTHLGIDLIQQAQKLLENSDLSAMNLLQSQAMFGAIAKVIKSDFDGRGSKYYDEFIKENPKASIS
jgi:hypothetical protein